MANVAIPNPTSIEIFDNDTNSFLSTTEDYYQWDHHEAENTNSISAANPPSAHTAHIRVGAYESFGLHFVESLLTPRPTQNGVVRPDINNMWVLNVEAGDEITLRAKAYANDMDTTDDSFYAFIDGTDAAGSFKWRQISNGSSGTVLVNGSYVTAELTIEIPDDGTTAILPWLQARLEANSAAGFVDFGAFELLIPDPPPEPDTLYIRQTGFRFPYQKWT